MKPQLKTIITLTLALLSCLAASANSTDYAVFTEGPDRTFIAGKGIVATIITDRTHELTGVKWATENLAKDFERVTGKRAAIDNWTKSPFAKSDVPSLDGPSIAVGTIGIGGFIDKLLSENELNALKGAREKYILKADGNSVIIAGSDKRGTTYGVYALSSSIGVSPWYWWADVPAEKHTDIYIKNGCYTEGEPKIYYRGIFLNDEAPALTGWVHDNTHGYTSGFYKRVFELLLRLKANFMWPAMWDAAFYDDDPLNMYYADTMGIIMGTSHHEPCARAQKEWHRYGSGPWDYTKNRKTLENFWTEGIERMKNTEDVVTIGMRGDGDMAMEEGTNITLLERIINAQRKLISKATGKPASETPQVWALYKEVQDYYDKGMRVPDDVTLLLCDDNWGNVRKLPSLDEKPRRGGYGMYYHFDYVGGPRNYKWLNCNQVERVWEQMNLCWEYGVRKLWVVNVGDLKPMEYPIQFFMDMAWDPEAFNPDNIFEHTVKFASDQFGEEQAEEIAQILKLYSKYTRRVTPELLNAGTYNLESGEWDTVLQEWNTLETRALRVFQGLSAEQTDAYEELVLFPIQAMQNVYEMYYSVAMNTKASTPQEINYWAGRVETLYKRDSLLCAHYNHEIAGGKWNHMMDQKHIGYRIWQEPRTQVMPAVRTSDEAPYLCHRESDGYISIEAGNFSANSGITIIPDLGKTMCGATTLPATETPDNAYLEFSILTTSRGTAKINVLTAPTLNFNAGKGLQYALSVDGGEETEINFNGHYKGELGPWQAASIITSTAELDFGEPGRHILRFRFVDPGIVLEKIMIDFGGLQKNYLGAPSSELIK